MKIIIATGIFPPEIGGPAIYTKKLAEGLVKKGIKVLVVTLSSRPNLKLRAEKYLFSKIDVSKKYPKVLRYLTYFWTILRNSGDCDLIYLQDLSSVGIPAALANLLRRKKMIVRLGGDSLWEMAQEKGLTKEPLSKYYLKRKTLIEKIHLFFQNFVLKRCDFIIFSTDFLRDIFIRYRKIKESRALIIGNPFKLAIVPPESFQGLQKSLLYAGRLVKCKNLERLVRVVGDIYQKDKSIELKIIGQGPQERYLKNLVRNLNLQKIIEFSEPLSSQDLFQEIQKSYLCLLISLTEVSPNFAIECLNLKKPIILTKETGFYQRFKEKLVFVNPLEEKEIKGAILKLLDGVNYQKYLEILQTITLKRSWDEVTEDHLRLFKRIVSEKNEKNF